MVASMYKHLLCILYEHYLLHLFLLIIQWVLSFLLNIWKHWVSEKVKRHVQGLNPGVSEAKAPMLQTTIKNSCGEKGREGGGEGRRDEWMDGVGVCVCVCV